MFETTTSSVNKQTAGTFFKNQLTRLIDTLDSTHSHYIRCIKPNAGQEPLVFEEELVSSIIIALALIHSAIEIYGNDGYDKNQESKLSQKIIVP
jgi:hypothetical protein